jgi:hypothetical protein
MKKTGTLIVLGAITLALVSFFIGSWIQPHEYHAMGRLKVETVGTNLYMNFYHVQFVGITNLLTDQENCKALAAASKAEETSFRFYGVSPVRGTKLIYVHYSGADSNAVLLVASNAANLVISFYASNQPASNQPFCKATYIDTKLYTPTTPWERLWWRIEQFIPFSKN